MLKLVPDINLYVNDMGERLPVCAVQGLETGRFNEVLLHFLFEDIKQTKNNTV